MASRERQAPSASLITSASHVNSRQTRAFGRRHRTSAVTRLSSTFPFPLLIKSPTPQQTTQTRCAGTSVRTHPPCGSSSRMALLDEPPGDDRQSCSSTPTPPPTTPLLSINRLLALHPRERLLVHPMCWTDRQLALLGCRIHSHYEEADGAGAGADENARATSSKSDRLAAFLAERLNCQLHYEELADTMAQLLRPLRGRISIELQYVCPMSIVHTP